MSAPAPTDSAIVDETRLSAASFERLARLVESSAGIVLHPGKEMLVHSRLAPRIAQLGEQFESYVGRVTHDRTELARLIDLLTTNKTDFFRESQHFDFLSRNVWREAGEVRPLRIWCAGCSTGEEPYSVAISWLAHATSAAPDPAILATDISPTVLEHAKRAEYPLAALDSCRDQRLRDWTEPVSATETFRVQDRVRRMVSFARLNLVGSWPMRGPFDLILCRNVMIYFSRDLQQRLANRFSELLNDGGYLLIGHAESLDDRAGSLRFVQPAVYRRPTASHGVRRPHEGVPG